MNYKGADQTARMHRMVCACVVQSTEGKFSRDEAQMFSGVVSLLPVRSHTFLEIDREIIFMVGWIQVQAKVCA